MLPDEFNIYNSFLIREKADGILVNNLSTNIFPECEKLKYCIVKAEFIENNDLYFVFYFASIFTLLLSKSDSLP